MASIAGHGQPATAHAYSRARDHYIEFFEEKAEGHPENVILIQR